MARLSEETWRLTPTAYPRGVEIRATYGDVDSFQHLNNVAVARFFEEGRAAVNMEVFGEDTVVRPCGGVQLLFVSVAIQYLAQGRYPGSVYVATAVSQVGGSSFNLAGGLFQNGRCIALCEAVSVYAREGRAQPLPAHARAALTALQLRS